MRLNKAFAMFIFLFSIQGFAETSMQCAVDKVVPDGARVNVLEVKDGTLTANLIFGTTVSGTLYHVGAEFDGYNGSILNKPKYTISLEGPFSQKNNGNVAGYIYHLNAIYPAIDQQTQQPIDKSITADLVCGRKITDKWK